MLPISLPASSTPKPRHTTNTRTPPNHVPANQCRTLASLGPAPVVAVVIVAASVVDPGGLGLCQLLLSPVHGLRVIGLGAAGQLVGVAAAVEAPGDSVIANGSQA